ncbi:hypothetical protein [Sapientia aquatica]|uniref:DM13 domain-containing protein n=1 Tax=Sapientia aquatica TaxID=1549640 RepID=A0A4R5VWH5_9BURK|nr:hypothetical protein [Sapientia aquatica]TDK63704.1 hypothetical protein E2I14_14105 [Sapientia aquatica]
MNIKIALAALLSWACISAFGETIEFNTKETGFSNIEYKAKVVSSTDRVLILNIPGFDTRSAVGSRWMMCVYTNLALMNHQKFMIASYPTDGSDNVSVGFPESESQPDVAKLGGLFSGDHALKVMPVDKMMLFCVQIGYKFKYDGNAPQNAQ